MTVFKSYFKILKRGALVSILIYIGMGIGILSIFKSGTSEQTNQFTTAKPYITVYNEDNSEFSEIFVNYLNNHTHFVDVENTESARLDALFYRQTSYFVTIPKGFGKSIEDGNIAKLETQNLPDLKSANLAESLIDNYLKTFQIYNLSTDLSLEEISKKVEDTLSNQTEVSITNKGNVQETSSGFFYTFISYIIMTVLISSITLIAMSFNEKDIRRRINSSALSLSSFNFQIALGHFTVMLGTYAIVIVLGKLLYSIDFFTTDAILHLINIFVFSLVTLAISFRISNLVSSIKAISPITTVVCLGSAFLGGSFVPQEYLSDSVKITAIVNPVYWYVKATNNISSVSVYTYENLKPTIISMTIEILFGIVFLFISMAITKYRRTQN